MSETLERDPSGQRGRRTLPGRRRRTWRSVLGTSLVVAVLAGAAGWVLWRASRPAVRLPGESMPEITEKLARGLPEDAPLLRFTDVTAAAGLSDFVGFAGRRTSQLPEDMGAGAAWGDFDDDGDDDLFLVSAGGDLTLPVEELAASELYENRGDARFLRVAGFPDLRIRGMAAAWGDYDGDGRLDLAVSGYEALRLFHNSGGGAFVEDPVLQAPGGYWAGLTWGDFDRDGDLDLYVCGYVRYVEEKGGWRATEQYGRAVPYTLNPASFEPQRNLLFENRGGHSFAEVAELLGVSNPGGRSLSALWHDFDQDGWLDLYVANDISDNALFANRAGETFEDIGLSAWVADYRGAMGLAVGDWNRDGDDDLFVAHWVAQENALYDSRLRDPRPEGVKQALQLTFADLASPLGLGQIAVPMVGWGTEMADFDNDGWLDLVVQNGSTFETDDDRTRLKAQPSFLFWNRRGEGFFDLAPGIPALAEPRVGRGLAVSDYDADGDLDLLLVRYGEGVQLLRNEGPAGHWLELQLDSRGPAGARGWADHATVVATIGEATLRRTVGGVSYLSQNSRTLHFGLGEAQQVDRLTVSWPSGEVAELGPLAGDARWLISQGESAPRRLASGDPRARLEAFWEAHRGGMDAIKRDGDAGRAAELFRAALAIDPAHEDARYYLAACLAALGEPEQAITELEELVQRSPRSHRGLKQLGTLRALLARGEEDLVAANELLERALDVNREETGALLVLGEIALLRHDAGLARQRLVAAGRTNPRAVSAFFLQGYLAWKDGDEDSARSLLTRAQEARGEAWKPEGTVAEGDVRQRLHREETPLAPFWRGWDGGLDPATAFNPLDARLKAKHSGRSPIPARG